MASALLVLAIGAVFAKAGESGDGISILKPRDPTEPAPPAAEPLAVASRSPAYALLELATVTPGGTTRLTLYENGIAVLQGRPANGKPTLESRLFTADEMVVYDQRIRELVPKIETGALRSSFAESTVRYELAVEVAAGERRSWSWNSLDTVPLAIASLHQVAEDLAQTIRDRWKLGDAWRKKIPAKGERFLRSDGVVFEVVSVANEMVVELKAVDQPLTVWVEWLSLGDQFLPARDPTGIGAPVTPEPVKPGR